jgi:hypothetical protein
LFSNTLNLFSSLSVRGQVSHPYNTTREIMVLYILIFKFLERRRIELKTVDRTVSSIFRI